MDVKGREGVPEINETGVGLRMERSKRGVWW